MQEMQDGCLSGEDPLEKEMATHFSILAWEIPWTGEPGGLPSMGSHRVGRDLAAAAEAARAPLSAGLRSFLCLSVVKADTYVFTHSVPPA